MSKTLIILAHPDMGQSRLNKTLSETLKDAPGITVHDLYAAYKNPVDIDVAREQQLLLDHDRIVFQFPLYWYSTPSLLKEWQDRVLEYGFAYGSQGNKLAGKRFMAATTTGGPESAYVSEGSTIVEVLKPLQMMAAMTQMEFTPPFVVYGGLEISDAALAKKANEYRTLLSGSK